MKFLTKALSAALLAQAFFQWQNHGLRSTEITLRSSAFPPALDGVRIAHLSDLHNADYGGRLPERVRAAAPDLIVVTGDIISRTTLDPAPALRQLAACAAAAPAFYVPGNHEFRSRHWRRLYKMLWAAGVTILCDSRADFPLRGGTVTVVGLLDPVFGGFSARKVAALCGGPHFPILLSHRPERLTDYAAGGARLVFCGHAHGGQLRLPGIGGLVAPGQGFFPKYTAGVHRLGRTIMVVSRGLGGVTLPPRLFNRPEVVVVQLKSRRAGGALGGKP